MLTISAKRGKWRDRGGIEASGDDKSFATRRPQALSRDGGRCRFCGVKLSRMHVHHKDDDHANNELQNLMTVDDLCHAVNHVGLLGKSGVIAYLPALSQEDISHLTRAMLVVIARGGKMAELAKALGEHLFLGFAGPVEDVFGSSNPSDFGNALLLMGDSSYNSRSMPLRDVRVLFRLGDLSKNTGDIGKSIYPNSPDDIVASWRRIADDIDGNSGDDDDDEKDAHGVAQ